MGERIDDPGLGGKILKWHFKKWDGGMEWIDLAQSRDGWQALVNTVTNLPVPSNAGTF